MKSKSLDITYKYCGELSLLLQGTTYTFGTAQSCNFKKMKVYKTKLYYKITTKLCVFFNLYYRDARTEGARGVTGTPNFGRSVNPIGGGQILPTLY